jgi:hypothetical protein
MIEKEEEILATVLEGLSLALSVGFSKGASDSYTDAIDGAMVAIQKRLRMLAKESKLDS